MSYPIMLCINDRNGNEDRLIGASFNGDSETLDVEGDLEDGEPFLIVGNRWLLLNPKGEPTHPPTKYCEAFRFISRRRHVGNIHWDLFVFSPVYAAKLATYLSNLPHWSKQVWSDEFGAAWDAKEFDPVLFLCGVCEVCEQHGRLLYDTGSGGVLDGRFCSRECLEAYVESK